MTCYLKPVGSAECIYLHDPVATELFNMLGKRRMRLLNRAENDSDKLPDVLRKSLKNYSLVFVEFEGSEQNG
jgi:hypothetical protein